MREAEANMNNRVTINDVGPRDGLQNQSKVLSPDERIQLIAALVDAGVTSIEAGSFVSDRAVPAMAGAAEVFSRLPAKGSVKYSALAPTMKYYEMARDAGAKVVEVFVCASETMNEKNIRTSVAQSMINAQDMTRQAQADGIEILGCIAVAWECPFEGATDPQVVHTMAQQYVDMGVSGIVVADTIGAANPQGVFELMSSLSSVHNSSLFSGHFHDTRAMGMANVYGALRAGIRNFDASVGGLGGCPFAPGATGNVATEDLVMMLHQMGYETGIDLEKLMMAGKLAGELTETCTGGRADKWRRLQLEKQRPLS
jgi:hydroxymethylglutaryl-CoA lyase